MRVGSWPCRGGSHLEIEVDCVVDTRVPVVLMLSVNQSVPSQRGTDGHQLDKSGPFLCHIPAQCLQSELLVAVSYIINLMIVRILSNLCIDTGTSVTSVSVLPQ